MTDEQFKRIVGMTKPVFRAKVKVSLADEICLCCTRQRIDSTDYGTILLSMPAQKFLHINPVSLKQIRIGFGKNGRFPLLCQRLFRTIMCPLFCI
jgi:hypothetical protein